MDVVHSACACKYFNPWSHPLVPFLFRSSHFLVGLIEKYLQTVDDSQPASARHKGDEEQLYIDTKTILMPTLIHFQNRIAPNYIYIVVDIIGVVSGGTKNPHALIWKYTLRHIQICAWEGDSASVVSTVKTCHKFSQVILFMFCVALQFISF